MTLKEQVGRNIKEARVRNGITREDLAATLKTSVTTIYRYESGKLNLSANVIERIARALNCEVKVLFEPCR